MIKLKQTITACLLSAILVSAIALPAFAVDESVDQTPVVVDEQVDENSDTGGTQDSEVPVDTPADEPVDTPADEPTDEPTDKPVDESSQTSEKSEISVVSDTPIDESEDTSSTPESKQESRKEDSEEESEESKESIVDTDSDYKLKENEFSLVVDFACGVLSNTYTESRIDFSGVSMTLLSHDKKSVVKRYDMKNILNKHQTTPTYEEIVSVPSWKDGDRYYLHFDNLPEIYKVKSYDFPIEYSKVTETAHNAEGKLISGDVIAGVTEPIEISLDNLLHQHNMLIFTYDIKYKPAPNVALKVKVSSDEKVIYTASVKSTNSGYAYLYVPWEKLPADGELTTQISTTSVVNDSYYSGTYTFPYIKDLNVYSLYADGKAEELLYDDEGNKIRDGAEVPVYVSFKDAFDMSIFESVDLNMELYSGTSSTQSMTFNNNNKTSTLYLPVGDKFTFKSDTIDYLTQINPSTLTVKDGIKVTAVATPQLAVTVVNEKNGVKSNAHFKISRSDSEYNEQAHKFAVNSDYTYTVKNLDTGAVYDVSIGRNKSTIINIADGSITQTGYIPSGIDEYENLEGVNNIVSTTSTGSSIPNKITSVPKTGDIILGVGLTLGGLTLLSFIAYEYFKRKGKRYHETRN